MWTPHPDLHKYIQTASAPPSPEAPGPSHIEQALRGNALGTGTESHTGLGRAQAAQVRPASRPPCPQ